MSLQRRLSWNAALREIRDDRTKAPVGLLTARVQIQGFARFQHRPFVVAGKFDRSANMAASVAVTNLQERYGLTRAAALSTALKAAWQAAKMAHTAAAH